jgi:predicted flavoprotein YhiN
MAYPALGSKGEFLPVLAALRHSIVPPTPALVPLLADIRPVHKLQGVRLDARLTLYAGGTCLATTVGNVLFTDTGLSGPAAMNLSHLVSATRQAAVSLPHRGHRHCWRCTARPWRICSPAAMARRCLCGRC